MIIKEMTGTMTMTETVVRTGTIEEIRLPVTETIEEIRLLVTEMTEETKLLETEITTKGERGTQTTIKMIR